jgi:hypothetical protein
MTPERIIARLADVAEGFGAEAGVGAIDAAGKLLSFLADHPGLVDDVLEQGAAALPADWYEHGRLRWHNADRHVWRPAAARAADGGARA